jgi:hypothetical protein
VAPVALRFFYVIGPIFVVWAVALFLLGQRFPDFPRRIGAERIVIGVSAALMLAVILSATIGAKFEHSEQAKTGAEAHGKRGSPTP